MISTFAVYIGTPTQTVRVAIDTSDFDLWVNSNCTRDWVLDTQLCRASGVYKPAKSTTSEDADLSRNTTYYDGSSVQMKYYTDMVTLSTGLQVSDLEFGVAVGGSGVTQGILGLGYGETAGTTSYPTFVDQLASQQVTNSKAFSLALGNGTGNSGVIIFGGIDTQKFSGKLASVDILDRPATNYASGLYYVDVASVGINSAGGPSTKYYPGSNATVALSTGSTISYLPKAITTALNSDVGNGTSCVQGALGTGCAYPVPCSQLQNDTHSVGFAFGDAAATTIISVPLPDLIFDYGDGTCFLAVAGLDDDELAASALGLNFLRSAYVVFDQTLSSVFLGQYVDCGANEQEMPSSGAASFEGECESASPGSTASGAGEHSSGPLSTGAKAGIGVGAGVGAIAAAGLLAYLVVASRRRGRTGSSRRASWNGGDASYAPAPEQSQQAVEVAESEVKASQGPHELVGGSSGYAPTVSDMSLGPASPSTQFAKFEEEYVPAHHAFEMDATPPHVAELA